MRQRELEMRLEVVPPAPNPSPSLEQYRTPPRIAADMLYRALARGDIGGRRVLDLGCGTGMFAIGALLLGAKSADGVDVDAGSVRLGEEAARKAGVSPTLRVGEVASATGQYDTVVMNPPFGAQLAARRMDTRFVETGLRLAPVVYSLHLSETGPHIERLAARLGVRCQGLARYDFPLPAQFKFHTREKRVVPVSLYRFER